MKHAILLQLLAKLARPGEPLTVLDTHAGAGLYDLTDAPSLRSGEAAAGVAQLLAAADTPAPFAPLASGVRAVNPDGGLRWYPGSPMLIVQALAASDRYVGCELRADDAAALDRSLQAFAERRGVVARTGRRDGFQEAADVLRAGGRGLIFVDPPFEAADDYTRIERLIGESDGRSDVSLAIWTPLKDLETFDALLRALERRGACGALIAEVRLRPLHDPMRMNGCAMILIGAPDISAEADGICEWTASRLGEPGAFGRSFTL